ncbi:MAG: hypothetical protein ABIU05_03110, partial [Nitrospirales bacterium]
MTNTCAHRACRCEVPGEQTFCSPKCATGPTSDATCRCEDLYSLHSNPGGYLAFLGHIAPEKQPDHAIELAKRVGIPLRIAAKPIDWLSLPDPNPTPDPPLPPDPSPFPGPPFPEPVPPRPPNP